MRGIVSLACALSLLLIGAAKGEFIGNLEFTPVGCEATGLCGIKSEFKYRDPTGVEWLTTPPDKTDGVSIPTWAQPFIGHPFDKEFIKAAVIHDHYCVRQVRPWRQTHRVFYDALRESGVSTSKAKLMYYAVYLGGPKWLTLMPPWTCPGAAPGKDCVFKFDPQIAVGSGGATISAASTLISRPALYDQPGFVDELKEVERILNERGDQIDLSALERRAQERRPNDFFYRHGDLVEIGMTLPPKLSKP
jgi:Protein of unknown function (DUF1353)